MERVQVPRQSTMLTGQERRERLELAAGAYGDRAGCAFVIAWLAGVGALLMFATAAKRRTAKLDSTDYAIIAVLSVATLAAIVAATIASARAQLRRDQAVKDLLAAMADRGFPSSGLDEYFVADRGMLDVVTRDPVDVKRLTATARAIDGAIEVEALDEHTVRLTMPALSRDLGSKSTRRTATFGDRALLEKVMRGAVETLHGGYVIREVQFGGTILRRHG